MKNILSLDVGEARVGVAIGYEETKNCFPMQAIKKSEANIKIKNIINQKKISLLVVGLPLDENNNETTTSKKIRLFASNLAKENDIEVIFVDEYYSSQEAIERLNLKSKDQKTRNSGVVDSLSATIILERYFTNEGIIV